jgi:hypothetical protein
MRLKIKDLMLSLSKHEEAAVLRQIVCQCVS